MEVEHPLPTAEEVEENLVASIPEIENTVAMEVKENPDVEVNPNEGMETSPIEGVEKNINVPEKDEIVISTDDEEEAEKVPPNIETDKPDADVVRTYQRRPAREETSKKRSEGGHPRETPGQGIGGNINSTAKSASGVSSRRRRLLIDEEPEEEDDIFFQPIGEQLNQRQPDILAGVDDCDRQRKRKGKAIATPVKKKSRQSSMVVVIQERDPHEVRHIEEKRLTRMKH